MSAAEGKGDSGEVARPKAKPLPTTRIGRSKITDKQIGMLLRSQCLDNANYVRMPKGEETPKPRDYEMVVFKDYFVAGLRLPCDAFLGEVLERYNLEPHDLTPNGIARVSQFVWACRSQGVEPDTDAFARLFDLHRQPKKAKFIDSDGEFEAQYGSCSFIPRKSKQGPSIVVAQKNK